MEICYIIFGEHVCGKQINTFFLQNLLPDCSVTVVLPSFADHQLKVNKSQSKFYWQTKAQHTQNVCQAQTNDLSKEGTDLKVLVRNMS